MENERISISVGADILVGIPHEESYVIMQGEDHLGVISPDYVDDNLVWVSADLMAPEMVEKIGEAIEEHDM